MTIQQLQAYIAANITGRNSVHPRVLNTLFGELLANLPNDDDYPDYGSPVTPAAPTNGIVNDTLDTFTFTRNPLFTISQHEYRMRLVGDNFTGWLTATTNVISVGNFNIAAGDLQVRVKAIGANPASATLFNATAFNEAVAPPDTYRLTVIVTGLSDTAEVAYNGEVWPGGYKDFPASPVATVNNLTPTSTGWTFDPPVAPAQKMDQNRTVTFAATAVTPGTTLLPGYTYADLFTDMRPNDGVFVNTSNVWTNSSSEFSAKNILKAGYFGLNSEFSWQHTTGMIDVEMFTRSNEDYFGQTQFSAKYLSFDAGQLRITTNTGIDEILPQQPINGQFVRIKRTTLSGLQTDTYRVSIVNSSNVEVYGKNYSVDFAGDANTTRLSFNITSNNANAILKYPQWKDLINNAPPQSGLVQGNSRIRPSSWTTNDNGVTNTVVSNGGSGHITNLRMTGDGIFGYVFTTGTYQPDTFLAVTNDAGGTNAYGFYFNGDQVAAEYRIGGSWNYENIETRVEGAFYGIRRVGSTVTIVKSTDFINYTTVYTYSQPEAATSIYIRMYQETSSIVSNFQGIGITTV